MARHMNTASHFQFLVVVSLMVITINDSMADSVAADVKDLKTGTIPHNNTDPSTNNDGLEEKVDPRIIGGYGYTSSSYGGYNSGYGVTPRPYFNSAYSGSGNYGSNGGSSNTMASNYGLVTAGPYSTSYGSASYSPANYGIGSSYGGVPYGNTGNSYGGASYGVNPVPSYGGMASPTYGGGSYSSGSFYGVHPAYGNNIGSSYDAYAASHPSSSYGNNMNTIGSYGSAGAMYGAGTYGAGTYGAGTYGAGTYGGNTGSYGGVGNSYGATSSPYSSISVGTGGSSSYGGNYGGGSYGNGNMYGGMMAAGYGMGPGSNSYPSFAAGYYANRNPFGYWQ